MVLARVEALVGLSEFSVAAPPQCLADAWLPGVALAEREAAGWARASVVAAGW